MAAVGSIPAGAPPMAMWNTYIWVDSADETAAKARDAGGGVAMEPFDIMDAGRMAVLTDPEGAAFCVWQARTHKGAHDRQRARVAQLQRPRHQGSRRCRGVLRRRLRVADAGAARRSMWALPGYGDHLEEGNPGLREQIASMGGPEGFIDVVAALQPIAGDDSETPAHWNVTFATDDAEATAAKATELGGEIVAGPLDAPWTRLAVIKDPQGATFIASQFVPENQDLEA